MVWKPWAAVGLCAGALAVGLWYGEQQYEAGANACKVVVHDGQQSRDVARLEALVDRQTRERDAALAMVEQLKNAPEVAPREIIRVVENSNCERLGRDYLRLFNAIHTDVE